MCPKGMAAIDEEIMEFRLAERCTFLEYVPVKGISRCTSAPELKDAVGGCPTFEDDLEKVPPSVVPSASCGASCTENDWSDGGRSLDWLSTCSSMGDSMIEFSGSDGADETPKWSIGSQRHAEGLCKPCAWFWRPGSCILTEHMFEIV
ncbi:unnamed protein product [Durusdinium trenchii]|uniref:Uncharacterized protein n=1 Tax=Durusdinium trenchii TaxID=1381693 RepID=A0ABP0PBC6_9DINO